MKVEVRGVSKSYKKNGKCIQIIKEFSHTFESGKMYIIQGESGKGKTTLLTMLGLLQDCDSGEILMDGKSIHNVSREKQCSIRRENIGIVFQDFNLFNYLSVIENVTLVWECTQAKEKEKIRQRAKELLQQFGLGDRTMHKPTELSGGEMQRVGLVRAIFSEPQILICDEPVSNLDKENTEKIVRYIDEYCHKYNKIVIVTSHDNSFQEYADEIIEL